MASPASQDEVAPLFPHFVSAVDAVRGLVIKGPHPKPRVADRRPVHRDIGIAGLPLVPCGDEMDNVISFCDVLMDVNGPLDIKKGVFV